MASTPTSQSAAQDANDKKRNKLGYHRTSVACVHCRRRKIRCLVAPDDAEGRCENCIRLRKDCQFFPVDQQPPIEKKSRPNSRLETPSTERSNTTPVASSPTNLVPDPAEGYYPYQTMPMNTSSAQELSPYNVNMVPTNPMGLTPDRPLGPGDFAGHQTMDAGVAWDEFTTISDPHMLNTMAAKGQMMNMAPNVWNPGNMSSGLPPPSPISAASPMGNQTPMNSTPAFAMQPDGTVWQVPPPPPRTMSYPGQEIGSAYPNQYHPQMPPELKRRMTTPAQPLSAPNALGSQGSPGSDMHTPGSVSYPPGMNYTQWQDMSAMPPMGVVPYPMYTGEAQQPYNPPMGHPGPPGRSPNS
ncbi:hypothetical protein N7499_001371 [Penicillium canescens]|nr:hypothetical protein N7499_001371 [Penicillium canescens]KAJ6174206.1 hypothetical protein N7485_007018 [Penicillium canescens]